MFHNICLTWVRKAVCVLAAGAVVAFSVAAALADQGTDRRTGRGWNGVKTLHSQLFLTITQSTIARTLLVGDIIQPGCDFFVT